MLHQQVAKESDGLAVSRIDSERAREMPYRQHVAPIVIGVRESFPGPFQHPLAAIQHHLAHFQPSAVENHGDA